MKRFLTVLLMLLIAGNAWAARYAAVGNIGFKGGGLYDVKTFGATGDGSTDDTSAINSAIAALSAGDTLYFPEGTYVVSSALTTISTSVNIVGAGIGKSIIDATTVGTGPVLDVTGTATLTTTVASAVSEGDYQISLASASGLSVNDFLYIRRKNLTLTGTWTFTNSSASVTANADGDALNEVSVGDWIGSDSTSSWVKVSAIPDADTITLESAYTDSTHTDATGATRLNSSTELWDGYENGYYNKSEYIQIARITGNVIDLRRPAYDDYLGNTNTEVYTFAPLTVTWSGFEIQCDANIVGAQILYAQHVRIRDLKITGARERGLWFRKCVDVTVDSYVNYDTWYSGTGTSYGIVFDSSQDVRVTNCELLDGRHGMTTGTGLDLSGINRNFIVTDSQFAGRTFGFSTHANIQYLTVSNCDIEGGGAFNGQDIQVVGNTLRALNHADNPSHGVAIYIQAYRKANIFISGNTLIATTNITNSIRGLFRSSMSPQISGGQYTVSNNRFDMQGFTGKIIYFIIAGPADTESIIFDDNTLYAEGSHYAQFYLNTTPDGGSIKGLSFLRNYLTGVSLYIKGRVDSFFCKDNSIKDAGYRALLVFADTSGNGCLMVDISNNYITDSEGAGMVIQGDSNSSITLAYITNNKIFNNNYSGSYGGGAYDRSGCTVRYLKTCYVKDNIFSDTQVIPTQNYGVYAYNSVDALYLTGNDMIGNTSGPVQFQPTLAFRYTQNNRPHNQARTLGAAATTFDVWADRMTVTGDSGGNTIATITGGEDGKRLTLEFVDSYITITDDDTHAADSIDLIGPFKSSDDATLILEHDGTNWYEISRSQEQSLTTVAAASYTVLGSDKIIHVTYTPTGTVALTLPTALMNAAQLPIVVKDAGGNAGANNITIATGGAETIDGGATYVISTNYDTITLYSDGSNWFTY